MPPYSEQPELVNALFRKYSDWASLHKIKSSWHSPFIFENTIEETKKPGNEAKLMCRM